MREMRVDKAARRILVRQRHRIFQVEDDGIGAAAGCPGLAFRPAGRNEQRRADVADRHH
jgi:hypothetical protein